MRERFERFYHFSISNSCWSQCQLCSTLGCLAPHPKSASEIDQELDALRDEYEVVVFPPNTLETDQVARLPMACRTRALIPVFRFYPWQLTLEIENSLRFLSAQGGKFEAIIDRPIEHSIVCKLRELKSDLKSLSVVIVPTLNFNPARLVESISVDLAPELEVLAPLKESLNDCFMTPDELNEFLDRSQAASSRLKPYREFDRNPVQNKKDLVQGLEVEELFQQGEGKDTTRISVIIPFDREKKTLALCLSHIGRQSLAVTQFEVILVCDQCDPVDFEALIALVQAQIPNVNFRMLSLAPTRNQIFRSGIARNAGAWRARGDVLVFLDSDALTPPEFLEDVLRAQEENDVIQYRGLKLPNDFDHALLIEGDAFHEALHDSKPDRYWTPLYDGRSWREQEDGWKLVSTFCLAVKIRHFINAGGFPRAISTYGCEDIFLGWKLWQLNIQFSARLFNVYHTRTNRMPGTIGDLKSVSASAQAFYLATLDPSVYRVFFSALGPSTRFRWIATRMASNRFTVILIVCARFLLFLCFANERKTYLRLIARKSTDFIRDHLAETWRIRVFLQTILLKLIHNWLGSRPLIGWLHANVWKVLLPLHFVKANAWKLKMPFLSIKNELVLFAHTAHSALRKFRETARLRIKVWTTTLSQRFRRVHSELSWRIPVLAGRLKLRFLVGIYYPIRSNLWRVKLIGHWTQTYLLQPLHANRWAMTAPEAWLITKAPTVHRWFVRPIKKAYYFSMYQLRKFIGIARRGLDGK